MTETESPGEVPKPLDTTKAGALTLHEQGISFAVDGTGQVLRKPDGTPIDGKLIEDTVNQSGRRLTNAEAAGHIIAAQQFCDGVEARINELRSSDPATSKVTDPGLK